MSERRLLEAARAGDEHAFARLVEPHRGVLHAHCYRMLGSVPDAEDALQEALLSAWRGLAGFEGRSSLRSWLYAIATNACLRAIERRESVELAFIAALQHLPARQRAVLILRDVLGFSAREAAGALETTPTAVDSALQHAHKAVDRRVPERSQQAVLRSLDDQRLREIVEGFVDAWERADVDAVVAMLASDAAWTVPPLPTWYRGREAIAAFLEADPLSSGRRWRLVPTRANGQPALGKYSWDEERGMFAAYGIAVLTLEGERIADCTSFLDPKLILRFGLPHEIAPRSTTRPIPSLGGHHERPVRHDHEKSSVNW
jgi:RNA polymerase sigma-70 factor, ECF subfamily